MNCLNMIIALLIVFNLPLLAQQPIKVEEVEKAMSQGTQPGLSVHVHQALPKDVEKSWEKLLKSNTVNKAKVEEDNDEIFATEVVLERISNEPIAVYSRLLETKTGVELTAYFKGENGFFSPDNESDKYKLAKLVLYDFAKEGYREAVENELDIEDKNLKQLNKDLDKLMDEQKKLEGKIVDYTRDIEKAKAEILTNESDQGRLMEQISDQKDKIIDLKDSPDAQKEAEKTLKDMEKDLKKIHNQIDKLHKEVADAEADIRSTEHDIATNLQDQKHKKEEIEAQKDLIEKIEQKLKGIEE